jgi:hypothetical protein
VIATTRNPWGPPHENCCLCGKTTPMWEPVRDVAVCDDCADAHTVDDLPTKRDWCEAVRLARATGKPYRRPPATIHNKRII